MNPRPRILCVDDEPHLLDGLARNLRFGFDVTVAASGAAGLDLLAQNGPFAVVVSDMQMPGMTGAEFLGRVRVQAPDTVRVLLTGRADLTGAIAAVNEGHVFRFLTKPCDADLFRKTMEAAVHQYGLVTSEKVLLELTLCGCIRTLAELLALSSPAAFGRAMRTKLVVTDLARALELQDVWQLEIAAMLSQIGGVSLPDSTAEKLYRGVELSEKERVMVDRMPAIADQLLANIPRLETVREIIQHQHDPFVAARPNPTRNGVPPIGSRLLRVAVDLDILEARGETRTVALATLRGRTGAYDPAVLEALGGISHVEKNSSLIRELTLDEVRPGMVLAQDVTTRTGLLLLARGQEVTVGMLEKIRNFSPSMGVREPILARVGPS